MRTSLLFAAVLFLSGCSLFSERGSEGFPEKFSLDLYMRRATVTQSDFEQYKTVKDKLVFECGVINNERYFVKKQQVFLLPEELREKILEMVIDILKQNSQGKLKLDTPGSGLTVFDPGSFLLRVSEGDAKEKIETSFDAVSKNMLGKDSRVLRRLASALQEVVAKKSATCADELRLQERVVERPGVFQRVMGWVGL